MLKNITSLYVSIEAVDLLRVARLTLFLLLCADGSAEISQGTSQEAFYQMQVREHGHTGVLLTIFSLQDRIHLADAQHLPDQPRSPPMRGQLIYQAFYCQVRYLARRPALG